VFVKAINGANGSSRFVRLSVERAVVIQRDVSLSHAHLRL
jgi:hypothetical protein